LKPREARLRRPGRSTLVRLGLGGALLLVLATSLLGGCSSIGYYAQAINGHLDVLQRARPVPEVIADPATSQPLRERLRLSQQMRDFAVAELKLPEGNSYRRYADLGRNAVVWNVVAAPELSLQLKTWCFPVVGCVGYRGYYRQDRTEATAAELRAQGYEVMVYGVPAYSTLGKLEWLGGDPLLNTFVNGSEADLARLIFHELAHQVLYVDDDTTFNESYATAVERIGGRLWMERFSSAEARAADAARQLRAATFRAFSQRVRAELEAVYGSSASDADKRLQKAAVIERMRRDYEALKADPASPLAGFAGYDGWFQRANNASFAVLGAYNDLVAEFERLFIQNGSDFERFHAAVKQLTELPRDARRARLATP
jgi:predicted aminopeptidase